MFKENKQPSKYDIKLMVVHFTKKLKILNYKKETVACPQQHSSQKAKHHHYHYIYFRQQQYQSYNFSCTGWPKKSGTIFSVRLNFTKYQPIFKIISRSESEENL